MTKRYMNNSNRLQQVPPQMVDNDEYAGAHRWDALDTTAAMAAGDTISMGFLQPGERLVGGKLQTAAHGAARTLTLSIGGTNITGALDISAAAVIELAVSDGLFGYQNQTQEPQEIIGTIGGGALAAAANGLMVRFDVAGVRY